MNDAIPQFDPLTILLVETNNDTIAAIGQYLESTGASVVRATSIHEVVEWLLFITPNIIMTNLLLDQGNGFRVLSTVREYERVLKRPRIPIIVIADYSDVEGEIALEAGFQAYIRTPIEPAPLYAAIRQFV